MIQAANTTDKVEHRTEDYFAINRMSNSKLKAFRENRKLFWLTHVVKTIQPKQPSAEMMLGTYLHLAILEPAKWRDRAAPKPEFSAPEFGPDGKKWLRRQGSEHERAWNELEAEYTGTLSIWQMENAGKIDPTDEQIETVERMADAMYSSEVARPFLELRGEVEKSILWQYADVECKSRLDKLCPGLILDVKTARNAHPKAFAKTVAEREYHAQRDFYRSAVGGKPEFLFLVVENVEPHTVAVYDLDAEACEAGAWLNAQSIDQYRQCRDSGIWTAQHERQVIELPLPKWALFEMGETA